MNFGLRTRFIIILSLAVFTLSSLGAYIGLASLQVDLERRLQDDVALIARAVKAPIVKNLEENQLAQVQAFLEGVFEIQRVYGAYVYDAQGKVIIALGVDEPPRTRSEPQKIIAARQEVGGYQQLQHQEVFSYFIPLTDSIGRSLGMLQLTRKKSDITDRLDLLRARGLALVLLTISVLTAVTIYVFSRTVDRPLKELSASMAIVASGDLSQTLPLDGPKELRHVRTSFNQMLQALRSARSNLLQQKENQLALSARLQQSEKLAAIGRLAAGVAHELGSPLTIIDGRARRGLQSSAEHSKHAFLQIREEVRRMEHIVKQLLDFARPPQGRSQTISARLLAHDTTQTLKELHTDTFNVLSIEESLNDGQLQLDPIRVEQLVLNLVNNAIEATDSKGPVLLRWIEGANDLAIIVEDGGPGISDEEKKQLFEPFYTTKAIGQGTGLGLSVVHGIVQEYHGRIEIGSSELGGAKFAVFLPLQQASESLRSSEEKHYNFNG